MVPVAGLCRVQANDLETLEVATNWRVEPANWCLQGSTLCGLKTIWATHSSSSRNCGPVSNPIASGCPDHAARVFKCQAGSSEHKEDRKLRLPPWVFQGPGNTLKFKTAQSATAGLKHQSFRYHGRSCPARKSHEWALLRSTAWLKKASRVFGRTNE